MNNNITGVLTSKNIKQQLNLLKKYRNFVSFVEVRVDTFYYNNTNKTVEKILNVLKKIKNFLPKAKIILTFRKFEEGGFIKVSEKTRFYIISKILEKHHQYVHLVDIEFFSKIRDRVINLVKKYKKTIILSYHELSSNTDIKKIIKINRKIEKFVKIKRFQYFVKVVFQCDRFADYIEVLKNIYSGIDANINVSKTKKITIFTVGKTSLLTRFVCLLLNMPFVYAAISDVVIPTQPTIAKLISIKKLLGS